MSNEVPEGIDLNCDAVPVDHENVSNDVNVGEPDSGAATSSLAETVTEGIVDGGVRDFGEDNVSAAGDDKLGKESKILSVESQGIDLEADAGSLGEVVDGKAGIGLSSGGVSFMEVDGGSKRTVDGESVSEEDKKPVEAEQMAVGSSGEGLNVSVCPNDDSLVEGTSVPSSSIADYTFHSDQEKPHQSSSPCGDQNMDLKDRSFAGSRETGDGESAFMENKKPVEAEQMAVGSSGGVVEVVNVSDCPNEDSLVEGTSAPSSLIVDNTTTHSGEEKPHRSSSPCGDQKMSSKEGSFTGLEGCDMEIDTPNETKKKRTTPRGFRNARNRFDMFNDAVNLNQFTSSDEDVSSDVDAKPEEPEFCVSDLVWAKVRSHPWWPAQIFDSSAATAKAKKYFKKGCYLAAYYGDQTFAWNEASQIKPFRPHFSRMEKQTNMEEFHHAVDCALDEVSRRVEFGLACSCISEEAYNKVKTEIIVNPGIREEFCRRDGGDRFSSAAFFDPFDLVETTKTLAISPYSKVDRLQFTISQSQLLAFHRWKGYTQPPEFQNLSGLLETDADIPLSEEVKKSSEVIGNEVPSVKVDEKVLSEKGKPDNQDGSSSKQKKILTVSGKKEKSLSEFLAERRLTLQNGKRKLNSKGGDKLMSSSPAKKLKAVEPVCDDSAMKQNKKNKSNSSTGSVDKSLQSKKLKAVEPVLSDSTMKLNKSSSSTGSLDKSLQSKQTFRIGACILRVASQMNSSTISTPILKHSDGKSSKSAVNDKIKGKASSGKSRVKNVSQADTTSPDEMLSQLLSTATDPLKGYNFLAPLVFFFTELRNSIAMDLKSSEMSEQSLEQGTDAIMEEKTTGFKLMGKYELTSIKGSSCSERIIQCLPEEQLTVNENKQTMDSSLNTASEIVEPQSAAKACANEDEQKHAVIDGNLGMDVEDVSPTRSAAQACASEDEQKDAVMDENLGTEVEDVTPTRSAAKACANEDEQKDAVMDENLGMEVEDVSPTALILKFSDIDSVPSLEELNKIFSRYGPLVTRGTEVLKKSIQAKVLFKRREDAETAFSSSGKYSIFGPSLVSYRLKRLASTPTKASQGARKRSRANETGGD